jgi:tRNA-uridine 2-sulfurtransferase
MKKVLVAMSGGVDSSVAAKLLKEKGYLVTGVFLRFWQDKNQENKASSKQALKEVKKVAKEIGLKLLVFNWQKEFKRNVVDYFLNEYKLGNTPNPCVVCNKTIKLGALIKEAKKLGFDYLASGHYLKKQEINKEIRVYKAKDNLKDQSYFLYTLSYNELNKLLFPLANYNKVEVRKLAKEYKLSVAKKSDSQDICFLSGPHNNFLKKHLNLKKGEIKLIGDNKVIGKHEGLALYTIGQRRGINIGGSGPYYVYKLDYKNNILWVVNTWDDKSLYKKEFNLKNINFNTKKKPKLPLSCQVVIRYGHLPINCLVKNKKTKNSLKVILNKKTRAITPGQSAVFYLNRRLIGGGVIDK